MKEVENEDALLFLVRVGEGRPAMASGSGDVVIEGILYKKVLSFLEIWLAHSLLARSPLESRALSPGRSVFSL